MWRRDDVRFSSRMGSTESSLWSYWFVSSTFYTKFSVCCGAVFVCEMYFPYYVSVSVAVRNWDDLLYYISS